MPAELSMPAAGLPSAASLSRSAASRVVCRQVASAAELADHFAIRHRIFVDEQAIFAQSDVDLHDRDASAVALIGYCDGVVAGTVRLFALDPANGIWQGDRLAVLAPYRTRGLGAPLVRCAVATAAVLGGRLMSAHIQLANVRFFQRLGWEGSGEREIYAGLVHQPMSIELPPLDEARAIVRRLAAGVSARDL
ncbi:MAG TPA: MSMEG_0567/Sll0786 family nitrogen starvation N-acetyltransferase [Propionibacteriaceae bacterium]|nr:MSMEG_0567/Sll0786 family nitrogen starvation N-acetyltransferase [Propionibacteriaceae bacterium]